MSRIMVLLIASGLTLVGLAAPANAQDEGEPTYVLSRQGPEIAYEGIPLWEMLKATDADGLPLTGLPVRFVHTGPDNQTAESCPADQLTQCEVTNSGGAAWYSFAVPRPGVVQVRAEVYSPEGVLLAEVGPDEVDVEQLPSCRRGRAKCSPLPRPWLSGTSKPGRDVLKVRAYSFRAGSSVVLLRKIAGTWSPVGQGKTAGNLGRAAFSVRDTNRQRRTRYRAVVLPSGQYDTALTSVVNLR